MTSELKHPATDDTLLVLSVRAVHAVTGKPLGPLDLTLEEPRWHGWEIFHRRGAAALVTTRAKLTEQPERTRISVDLPDIHARQRLASITSKSGKASTETADSTESAPLATKTADGTDLNPAACTEQNVPPCQLNRDLGSQANAAKEKLFAQLGSIELLRGDPIPAEHVLLVDPSESTVEITLTDQNGEPVGAARVELRDRNGASSVPLTEASWACIRSPLRAPGLYRTCPPLVMGAEYYPFDVIVDGKRVAQRTVDYGSIVTRHELVVPRTL